MPGDSIDETGLLETVHILFNERQRWYYLQGQQHSELLIFKIADSHFETGSPYGIMHCILIVPI
jgi:hypothetical protein